LSLLADVSEANSPTKLTNKQRQVELDNLEMLLHWSKVSINSSVYYWCM